MRCFVAIDLPEVVTAELARLSNRLRNFGAKASWVPPDRMHLTLRFLGEISEEQCAAVDQMLQQRLGGVAAVELAVARIGCFGKKNRPEVVWVGVEVTAGDITPLVCTINEAARECGVPPDSKPFRPHITLARVRDPRSAEALAREIASESPFVAGQFPCHNVTLYRSKLSPRGPAYSIIRRYSFGVG